MHPRRRRTFIFIVAVFANAFSVCASITFQKILKEFSLNMKSEEYKMHNFQA